MRLFSWTQCAGLVCTLAACGDSKGIPETGEQRGDSTAQTEAVDAGEGRQEDCEKPDCVAPIEADPCASVRCAEGTRCELDTRVCKDGPCPAAAHCVPVQSEAPVGCAQLSCEPGASCVEDAAGQGSCVPAPVMPIVCGQNTCAAGEECCNATCGLCAAQGSCADKSCAVATPTCDLKCESGKHCALLDGQCDAPPCAPKPACVGDDACTGPIIDCAAPPPDCNYVGGGCVAGKWTCGELSCAPPEECDPKCEPGQRCIEKEVQCFIAPCPVLHKCVPADGSDEP